GRACAFRNELRSGGTDEPMARGVGVDALLHGGRAYPTDRHGRLPAGVASTRHRGGRGRRAGFDRLGIRRPGWRFAWPCGGPGDRRWPSGNAGYLRDRRPGGPVRLVLPRELADLLVVGVVEGHGPVADGRGGRVLQPHLPVVAGLLCGGQPVEGDGVRLLVPITGDAVTPILAGHHALIG